MTSPAFGDHQLEIYGAGLRGVVPAFPMACAEPAASAPALVSGRLKTTGPGIARAGTPADAKERTPVASDGQDQNGPAGPQPSRRDKRLYLVLMAICIGLFVLSWAVLDRYSTTAAIAVSAVALVIPPFAVIIANAASATDRRRP